MTRVDHRAVILQDTPPQNQSIRAIGNATLIEKFCRTSFPKVFEAIDSAEDHSSGTKNDQGQETKSRR